MRIDLTLPRYLCAAGYTHRDISVRCFSPREYALERTAKEKELYLTLVNEGVFSSA